MHPRVLCMNRVVPPRLMSCLGSPTLYKIVAFRASSSHFVVVYAVLIITTINITYVRHSKDIGKNRRWADTQNCL